MIKRMICIECPKSCALSVDIENCDVKNVQGAKCPKGTAYAITESRNPSRVLTTTVLTEGLSLKLVSVRTDRPIPKKDLFRAMEEIQKMKIKAPVRCGDVIDDNFIGLGVKLLATRDAKP